MRIDPTLHDGRTTGSPTVAGKQPGVTRITDLEGGLLSAEVDEDGEVSSSLIRICSYADGAQRATRDGGWSASSPGRDQSAHRPNACVSFVLATIGSVTWST